MAASTETSAARSKPIRLTGVAVALVVLGVVMFALPPSARVWVALIVVTMALLLRGGDAARIIDDARKRIYGG